MTWTIRAENARDLSLAFSRKMNERRGQLFFCSAKLEVNGKLCCKGDLTFALVPIEK